MRAAGLEAISTVLETTAVLIKSKQPSDPKLVDLIASRIRGVISKSWLLSSCNASASDHSTAAQKFVLCTYNIERPKLQEAARITPGKRAPTINSLDEPGWVSVSAMVERRNIAVVMDDLTQVGACDILVTKIENTRTI